METPKVPTTNSQTTMKSTKIETMNDEKIENGVKFITLDYDEDGSTKSQYLEESYILEYNKSNVKGISLLYSDNEATNTLPLSINNVDKLPVWTNPYSGGDPIYVIRRIVLFYQEGTKAYFIVEAENVKFNDVTYYRLQTQLYVPNPNYNQIVNINDSNTNSVGFVEEDGKFIDKRKEIAINNAHGQLLPNLLMEFNNNDLYIYTNEEGNVKIFKTTSDEKVTDCENYGLTCKKIYVVTDFPAHTPVICTVKKDVYLKRGSFTGAHNVTVVLDGGNLYRFREICGVPKKIICKNGAYIDIPSLHQLNHPEKLAGASHSRIISVNPDCTFKLFNGQNNIAVEFNPMDFVELDDYQARNSAAAINLNNVLERIFKSIDCNHQGQRVSIKMPETHFGHTNFYLERPVVIPHNVTIDMSGAFIFVSDTFEVGDSHSIISFDTNRTYTISATSIIKNFTMRFGSNILSNKNKPDNLRCIFDLTHFQGTLEGIKIYLNFNTEIIAFWQPFGTPFETYSDRKIIRRCSIGECGQRNETPTAIFCEGDGNIIEQCILGYVAIICGHSYTIKGCLNDKYFLYDTTVDFNGSYWEVGQFEILDSKVMFGNCRLTADNNQFRILQEDNKRYYLGPWMSIDTDGCRKRLVNLFRKHNLNFDRFNQVEAGKSDNKRYQGRGVSHRSTVEFQSSIRANMELWGGCQPMASPLFKVGEGARIIGIENLESPDGFAIHNDIGTNHPDVVEVQVAKSSWTPLINCNFADIKSDIIVPENISIVALASVSPNLNPKRDCTNTEMGCDWNNDTFSNIRARFLLDEQRKLYSKEYSTSDSVAPQPGQRVRVNIFSNMSEQRYANLKIELLFNRKTGTTTNKYKMRQHFNRVLDADFVSFGQHVDGEPNLVPKYNTTINIGLFDIVKSYFDQEKLEKQIWKVNDKLSVMPVEHVEITDDLPKPNVSGDALNDYYGNRYEPLALLPREYVNVATRIQWIGENNVRAFMSALPQYGTWNDGDEVVIQSGVYRYFAGKWYEYISFRESTLQPIDPGDGGITIDPTNPIKPIVP